jgi:hypothetical protein
VVLGPPSPLARLCFVYVDGQAYEIGDDDGDAAAQWTCSILVFQHLTVQPIRDPEGPGTPME